MSLRVASGSLIPTSLVVSVYEGHGVLAENVPSTGTHGSGYAYPSLDLPADNGKEIRGEITSGPTVISGAGTITSFFAYEDTSFDLIVSGDCTVQWVWDLYVDGVLDTSGLTATVAIGSATLNAEVGSYALTGADASLLYSGADKVLVADGGTLTLTGNPTTLAYNKIVGAENGSFTLSGSDATLTYTPSTDPVLVAEAGNYALTGGNATLTSSAFAGTTIDGEQFSIINTAYGNKTYYFNGTNYFTI